MKVYNTLTKQKEDFVPVDSSEVRMYSCGPTVYWHQHVGNFRSYIFADILKRVLQYNGFKVKHIINVTDVGHLTSDADSGDDKVEVAAKREGKTASEISRFYFDEFHKDFLKLNLIEPEKWTWATEHIKEQIELIKELEEKGFTYKTGDGVYFDTSRDSEYGKLSGLKVEGLEAGKRVDIGEKKNKTDFALWKFSGEEKRLQEWDSPWGVGFPGWHIECSAMATKYLGDQFDIHTGGIDHIPVHHENEIAQSECGYGKIPWVKYWMHSEFLIIKGGKMSKSKGNIKTISDLEVDGFSPMDYRYFCLSGHYRKPITWSQTSIKSAKSSYDRLKKLCLNLPDDTPTGTSGDLYKEYMMKFEERINDDLDMPGALAVLWELIRSEGGGKKKAVEKMDTILGLSLMDSSEFDIPGEVLDLLDEREEAREAKDFERSDELRDEIEKLGFKVLDSKDGYKLEKL